MTWQNYLGGFAVVSTKAKSNLLKVAMLNVVIINPTKSKKGKQTHISTINSNLFLFTTPCEHGQSCSGDMAKTILEAWQTD